MSIKMASVYQLWRDENGIPHVDAESEIAMYRGQGFVHARDRGMQLLLMRILGKGRLSEILDSSEDSLEIDRFFRRMNWSGNTAHHVSNLTAGSRGKLAAYCEGINDALGERYPLEFKLMGYKPETWTMDDSILISRMVGYLTLAQSQGEIERLVVEMVQADVSVEKLEALFPGLLTELDVKLIQKVKLHDRIVSNQKLWSSGVPRMMASNNWVVSGSKTASGKPILANDPHLEVNRLPNVWCEMVISHKSATSRWSMGSSMPGLPGILIGRNNDVAWGATYSFIDSIDSWVEVCNKGNYYREEGAKWQPFNARKETILRKKKAAAIITFYENELGTLDGDPFEDQYLLVTRWAAADSGAMSVEAVLSIFNAKSVEQAMTEYGTIETGWNYIFADNAGDIGFQMSGKAPIRREGLSGLIPVPAWKKENHWQGFVALEDMPRAINPESGFICTANEDLNHLGNASPINMPMGSYRSDRIAELLSQSNNLTVEDMCSMHFDVYSRQAEQFMEIIVPLLPDTEQGKILKSWDLKYSSESKGAFLFEQIYKALYRVVFGAQGLGNKTVEFLQEDAGIFIDFYANFDRIILSENSPWFNGKTSNEIFGTVIDQALMIKPQPWSSVQAYTMKNIFFDGKLPKILGFDKGPITAVGGRATIHQGQIYRSGGRDTTFLPSFRMVTEFSEETLHTNLAGGPSDRRFSKWYCSDLQNWLDGKYKMITPNRAQTKKKF